MFPPLYSLFYKSVLLAVESQQVMMLRTMRLAAGGALAQREMQRMVTEKALAGAQIGLTAATGFALGKTGMAVASGAVRSYRSRVGKNRRRLMS